MRKWSLSNEFVHQVFIIINIPHFPYIDTPKRVSFQMNQDYKVKFRDLKCCVIIPTYNNATSLFNVLSSVLKYSDSVIVVNDGSTDATTKVLVEFPTVTVVNHPVNQGKGRALQTGFKEALRLGFATAITIDSDGQHFAEDLPVFLEKASQNPHVLIVGARNMEQSSVPGKSSFGHKFSNFWFWFETGIKIPDTQSGYRFYPLSELKTFSWITPKYEFEIEVLVRAAWAGIPIRSVPVKVFYASKEDRISHFRPFRDFSRVSVLNTVLVIITIFYIKPLRFIGFFKKKNIKAFLQQYLLNPEESNNRKILSVGFGVFMGIFPIWGAQLLVGVALCHFFRLNKVLFVLAAHVSVPPMIPLIIFLSYELGGVLTGGKNNLKYDSSISLDSVKHDLFQYGIGAVALAFAGGVLAMLFFFLIIKLFPLKKSSVALASAVNSESND